MRRLPHCAGLLLLLLLAGCSQDQGRDFARYYDEQGLFMLNLPAANDIVVTPPQVGDGGPGLLTGVVSSPPAPSPSPAAGATAFDLGATTEPDQTVYQALAVTSEEFEDLDEMALFFLEADPVVDVVFNDRADMGGTDGRLIVADIRNGEAVTASLAVAMTLGDGETGYLIVAIFPPGGWEDEQGDFERIVSSFRSDVPPGLTTFPVSGQAS
jgi:hypothetical protein